MSKIVKVLAREIIDSRGNPTIETEVFTEKGICGRAAVPSGASTGAYEAHELRDTDSPRFLGKGVNQAIENIKTKITPAILAMPVSDQEKIDRLMLEMDGTKNKANLGANSILAVSMACAKAAALEQNIEVFQYLAFDEKNLKLPVPLMNILNGGAHANNGLDVQEFMIAPICGGSFKEALRAGCEVFHHLKKILSEKSLSTAVGDEGGFAPRLSGNKEALSLISTAVDKAGYKLGEDIVLALDVAATEFYKDGHYIWEGEKITAEQLSDIYSSWKSEFPIQSIEDGFSEDDWAGWSHFTSQCGSSTQIVGDDLFVTNPERLSKGIEMGAANALLVKVNQIGSLTETKQAVQMAQNAKYHTVMSHRSGETEDTIIADLSVAMASEQIKTGSLCRGERTAKYNQLLRIEERLGSQAQFRGPQAFGL